MKTIKSTCVPCLMGRHEHTGKTKVVYNWSTMIPGFCWCRTCGKHA